MTRTRPRAEAEKAAAAVPAAASGAKASTGLEPGTEQREQREKEEASERKARSRRRCRQRAAPSTWPTWTRRRRGGEAEEDAAMEGAIDAFGLDEQRGFAAGGGVQRQQRKARGHRMPPSARSYASRVAQAGDFEELCAPRARPTLRSSRR